MLLDVKKILISVAIFTTIFSTCHADDAQKDYVKLSNLSVEDFFVRMGNFLYSDAIQKKFPIVITNLRQSEKDFEVDGEKYKAWAIFLAESGAEKADGEVTFFVDKDNCVFSLKITLPDNPKRELEYTSIFGAICWALDLTIDEADTLLNERTYVQQGSYVSLVEKQEKIVLVTTLEYNGVLRVLFNGVPNKNND